MPSFHYPSGKDTHFCGWWTLIALSKSFIWSWSQTRVLIMFSIKATKRLSKLHGNKVAEIKQCLSISVWTLKQPRAINTGPDINRTFSRTINVDYTVWFCDLQRLSRLPFLDSIHPTAVLLTCRLSQLVGSGFAVAKLKGCSKVLLMKTKPSSPRGTGHKRIWP